MRQRAKSQVAKNIHSTVTKTDILYLLFVIGYVELFLYLHIRKNEEPYHIETGWRISVSVNKIITGSDNDLLAVRCQAITVYFID